MKSLLLLPLLSLSLLGSAFATGPHAHDPPPLADFAFSDLDLYDTLEPLVLDAPAFEILPVDPVAVPVEASCEIKVPNPLLRWLTSPPSPAILVDVGKRHWRIERVSYIYIDKTSSTVLLIDGTYRRARDAL